MDSSSLAKTSIGYIACYFNLIELYSYDNKFNTQKKL